MCTPSVYLEDLYVKPEARGKGTGTALIRAIAQTAQARNCARFQWQVIDWNDPAIGAIRVWPTGLDLRHFCRALACARASAYLMPRGKSASVLLCVCCNAK